MRIIYGSVFTFGLNFGLWWALGSTEGAWAQGASEGGGEVAPEVEQAISFFEWLERHMKEWGACDVKKVGASYILCDQTRVDVQEIKKLFAMSKIQLSEELKKKGLQVEWVCAEDGAAGSGSGSVAGSGAVAGAANLTQGATGTTPVCKQQSSDPMFKEVTALHGKYVPESRKILIRSSASVGSLVHEYLHSLQAVNDRPVFGHVYKSERLKIQDGLKRVMDRVIALAKNGGKSGATQADLQEFQVASQAMQGFAPWQDLIDERSLFRLFIRFGSEFGASAEDLALAKKNMKFICENPKLKKLLPVSQCER
jgi:hypothetical protein